LHLFVVFVIGGVREIAFENLNGYSTATLWHCQVKEWEYSEKPARCAARRQLD